jgi:uncharacterized protein YrzB (UPF0473 family)
MTEDFRDDIIVLTDEDGDEAEYEFLDFIQMGEKEYVVLYPLDQQDDEEGEVVIFQIVANEDGDEEYLSLEDEDELYAVFDLFQQRQEEEDGDYEDEDE